MSRPEYFIKLGDGDFLDSGAICTGEQLAYIISVLTELLPDHIWYLADIDALPCVGFERYRTPRIFEFGNHNELISKASNVSQFHSGVFMALSADFSVCKLPAEVYTEDKMYRDIGMATVEIRTFDTSYFEIYSIMRLDVDLFT